jgi:hypothetical protein
MRLQRERLAMALSGDAAFGPARDTAGATDAPALRNTKRVPGRAQRAVGGRLRPRPSRRGRTHSRTEE